MPARRIESKPLNVGVHAVCIVNAEKGMQSPERDYSEYKASIETSRAMPVPPNNMGQACSPAPMSNGCSTAQFASTEGEYFFSSHNGVLTHTTH